MSHVFRVLHLRERRQGAIQLDAHLAGAAIDSDAPWRADEVSGGKVPLLPFAAIGRQLHRVAVTSSERLVAMHQRLHDVIARSKVRQRAGRVTESGAVDDRRYAGLPAVDV